MFGLIEILLILFIVMLVPLIALIDILRSNFEQNDKLIWVLVVIFLPLIGSILYFIIGRKKKIKSDYKNSIRE